MSTPLKPIPKSLPSSAKLPQTDEYVKERQEAMTRLFNVWSSLAEKYSKPLEEDDIVDVLTGDVVKDRGVISSWDRSQQGFFTGRGRSRKSIETREEKEETKEQGKGQEGEETYEEPPEREEEEFDELDSFATEVGCDLPHAKEVQEPTEHHSDVDNTSVVQPMPHSNFLNFRDDEDLKEFMEAEKRRKDLYGDDDSSDSDLEQLQSELREFRRRSSYVEPVESEDEVPYPPPSSSPLPPSSPIRTSSPMVPPPSPSVGTSSSSARASLSPLRSFKSPSHSSVRPSLSSARTSSRMPPPSSTSVSSSFFRAPPSPARTHSSLRASPWLSSSPALPIFPSCRASSSVRESSPDLFTSSSAASSSSVRLFTPSLPPSSSSSIRWSSHSPPSSSIRSSLPRLPPSPPVRSSPCFIFDSESEDELLGVWTQPEEKVSNKSPKSKLPHAIQEIPPKTPGPKLKRLSKRKRVVTSSEEESSPTHSLSVISSSTRAKSLSPKKRIVDKEALYSAYDDTHKDEGIMRKSTLRSQKHIISNG
ncbi:hypothetical protein JOM56_010517 [Amanita muscaria]